MLMEDGGGEGPPGRAVVEWYFGDLLGELAEESPLSRRRLVEALAHLEAALDRGGNRFDTRLSHRGTDETVIALSPTQWESLVDEAELTNLEAAGASELHRRMGQALGVRTGDRQPMVLATPAEWVDNAPLNEY